MPCRSIVRDLHGCRLQNPDIRYLAGEPIMRTRFVLRVPTQGHRVAAMLGTAIVMAACGAGAAPLSGSLGFESSADSRGSSTRGATALATLALRSGPDFTLAATRFDDADVGLGTSALGALGLPLAPTVRLRGQAARLVGDGGFRGWRFKAGPQFVIPGGSSLQLSYLRFEDNQGVRSDGAALESVVPVSGQLAARLNASFATLPQDLKGTTATAGLVWTPLRWLELSGEAGAARNGALTQGSSGAGLPLLGGGLLGGSSTAPQTENQVSAVALIGVRWRLP